jgi:hypothetical protein
VHAGVGQNVVRIAEGIDRQFAENPLGVQFSIRAAVLVDLSSDGGGLSAELQQRQLVRQHVDWHFHVGNNTPCFYESLCFL